MKSRKITIMILMIIVLMFTTVFYYYIAFQDLTVSHYELELEVNEPIRIVQLSDLHNAEFGQNNEELVELVKQQEPDLIFMSGDMLNRDDENTEIVMQLISSLKDIAPVYFGYGNHECEWEEIWNRSLRDEIEAAGAIVVDHDYVDIEFKGNRLRIGGYMGYYRAPRMFTDDRSIMDQEIAFAEDFENTDRIKLLINHIPTQWLEWNYIDRDAVDVVFSGHYHGGIIRIPFIDRGVFAPYVGWFPARSKGMYIGKKATCILSAGLGDERGIPRINNPPEIVVVDIMQITESGK